MYVLHGQVPKGIQRFMLGVTARMYSLRGQLDLLAINADTL